MAYWHHRNPLKSTTKTEFYLFMKNPTGDSMDLCREMSRLRASCIKMMSDLNSPLDDLDKDIKSYLSLLHGFISPPPEEVKRTDWDQMRYAETFKWTHTLYGNKVPTIMRDFVFEIISILEEYGIWLTKYASNLAVMPTIVDDQAKTMFKSLLKAAGIFNHVKEVWLPLLPQTHKSLRGSDFDPHVCDAYANQCLAEAQEITIARAINLKHKFTLVSALCMEAYELFQNANRSVKLVNNKNGLDGKASKWQKYLELKCNYYYSYAYCYMGKHLLDAEKCAEAIRSLEESERLLNITLDLCKEYNKIKGVGLAAKPDTHPALIQMKTLVLRTKETCQRENDLIYHQKKCFERPDLESKASHGIVKPEEFHMPTLHRLWIPIAYKGFTVPPELPSPGKKDRKPLPDMPEDNAREGNLTAPKLDENPSGCTLQ